ncbi:MAG: hypothetical protein R3B49_04265 [Phycisphaerales bacterium]
MPKPWMVQPPVIRLAIRLAIGSAIGSAIGLGGSAAAQTIDDPPEVIEQAEHDLPRVRPEAAPIAPTPDATTTPPKPGLTGGHQWLDAEAGRINAPARLPEGYVVVERPGRVLTAPSGHRVFVIDKGARQPGEGPMLLLPSRTLSRMDASLQGAPDVGVVISGLVYDYAGRNYLLATNFKLMTAPAPIPAPVKSSTTEPSVEAMTSPNATSASTTDDPEIAELFAELDDGRSGVPNIAPPPPTLAQDNPLQPNRAATADIGLIPDGTPSPADAGAPRPPRHRRMGHPLHNDLDLGTTDADRPHRHASCLLLERMEKVALDEGDGVESLVSGRVYPTATANTLPTIYQRPPGRSH